MDRRPSRALRRSDDGGGGRGIAGRTSQIDFAQGVRFALSISERSFTIEGLTKPGHWEGAL